MVRVRVRERGISRSASAALAFLSATFCIHAGFVASPAPPPPLPPPPDAVVGGTKLGMPPLLLAALPPPPLLASKRSCDNSAAAAAYFFLSSSILLSRAACLAPSAAYLARSPSSSSLNVSSSALRAIEPSAPSPPSSMGANFFSLVCRTCFSATQRSLSARCWSLISFMVALRLCTSLLSEAASCLACPSSMVSCVMRSAGLPAASRSSTCLRPPPDTTVSQFLTRSLPELPATIGSH